MDDKTATQIEASKKGARDATHMFLRNFSHVPDDKLTWTPTATSKSAIQIAAHTALTQGNFARMILTRRVPTPDEVPALVASMKAAEESLTDRKEIEELFRKNTEDVLAALDTLDAEGIDMELDSGQGWTMSMKFLMNLPCTHVQSHIGQIDYLQTCWGDQEIYV
jgi:uncharacterized damage-inducible protein DinB